MVKEYRTIEEVAGPLMLLRKVDGVKYDELGEIELPDGEKRRCRVLEINGSNVLVQLFESSAGLNLANSKVRFSGHGIELPVPKVMLGGVFSGMGEPIDGGPSVIPDKSVLKSRNFPVHATDSNRTPNKHMYMYFFIISPPTFKTHISQ